MKRDMDLIRNLLLAAEELAGHGGKEFEVRSGKFASLEIGLLVDHVEMMQEKGLVEANFTVGGIGPDIWISRLTWDGHEFLDSVRDPEIWRKTKEGVNAAKGFSFDLMKSLATGFLKTKIEKHTGTTLE